MGKSPPRTRNATELEIEQALRDAGDFLGAMLKHEAAAITATTGATQDLDASNEAHRLFRRDHRAFISTARTVWFYLTQAAEKAGKENWLQQRLGDDALCRFHRELANQDLHDHDVVQSVHQTIRWEADSGTPMVVGPGGAPMPARMTVTGFEGIRYHYNADELESQAAAFYERVVAVHGNMRTTELAARYFGSLQSCLKAGKRRGIFQGDSTSRP